MKNQHIIFSIIAIIFSIIIISGCTQQEAAPSGFLKYTNSTEKMSIYYPKDWSKKDTVSGTVITFISKQSCAITIAKYHNPENTTLDNVTTKAVMGLESTISEFNMSGFYKTNISGMAAQKILFTGRTGTKTLSFISVFTIKNNTEYALAFAAPPEEYDICLPVAETMFKSFRILE
jgi:hypothetical protein